MITDQQARRLMKMKQMGEKSYVAASKAGMDEKTARKYLGLRQLPSECKPEHTWRTRPDPFHGVWPEIEELLKRDKAIQAKTVFDYLCRKYKDRFKEGQLRTLQRRVKVWQACHGSPLEVMFEQIHEPGRQSQSDFTHMGSLDVRIQGVFFDHLFFHFMLPYSNWETGGICFSEGFESFSALLQDAFWELGGLTQEHRTDNFSAAVNNLSNKDEFTQAHEALLRHYGLKGSHNYPGNAHENGDVEQSHHRFKEAVGQELILRGSRDFRSRADYGKFLTEILKRRNSVRCEKLKDELAHLRRLPAHRLEEYSRLRVRVSRNSTIRVRHNVYSVDSRLIRETVEVRVYAEHLEVWYASKCLHQIPRLRGEAHHSINYRHVIDSLVRKPGAFAHYRYQSDLFPRLLFRVAYDELKAKYPASADREYVKILYLAAYEGETKVHDILQHLIEHAQEIRSSRVQELLDACLSAQEAALVHVEPVNIVVYDELLEQAGVSL